MTSISSNNLILLLNLFSELFGVLMYVYVCKTTKTVKEELMFLSDEQLKQIIFKSVVKHAERKKLRKAARVLARSQVHEGYFVTLLDEDTKRLLREELVYDSQSNRIPSQP